MKSQEVLEKLKKFRNVSLNNGEKNIILIDGDWGIGKTFTYKKYLEENSLREIYISLFNLDKLEDIDKKLISSYMINRINRNNIATKTVSKISNYFNIEAFDKLLENKVGFSISDVTNLLQIENLEFDNNIVLCFDDLERIGDKVEFKNLLGKIEQLHTKIDIIVLCNTRKLSKENLSVFDEYKEKVIDYTLILDSFDSDFLEKFINKVNLNDESKKILLGIFKEYGKNNLRYLIKVMKRYQEIENLCSGEEWFIKNQSLIVKGIANLELELSLGVYSKKELETLKGYEEYFSKNNKDRKKKDESELKKEVNFLNGISTEIVKIVELLYKYYLGNSDLKRELNIYFNFVSEYEEFYKLVDLYFLNTEGNLDRYIDKLEKLYLKLFDNLSLKDKMYGYFIYIKYKKISNSEITKKNKIKKKLKDFYKIKLQEKNIYGIDFDLGVLKEYIFRENKKIFEELKLECMEEIKNETLTDDYIKTLISNEEFEKIRNINTKRYQVTSYEVVKDFFETLMYKECPLSYWENDDIIFNLLSKEIKEKIINQIEKNIKNETDTILKERNFYLKNNLERNNL